MSAICQQCDQLCQQYVDSVSAICQQCVCCVSNMSAVRQVSAICQLCVSFVSNNKNCVSSDVGCVSSMSIVRQLCQQ